MRVVSICMARVVSAIRRTAGKIHWKGPVVGRRYHLFLPQIQLERRGDSPLHRQLSTQLSRALRAGGAADGARLPSSRVLARLLGVSRNTVLTAYDELAADGLVAGRQGSSTRVLLPRRQTPLDAGRLLRDAQYPRHVMEIADPDGATIRLIYDR